MWNAALAILLMTVQVRVKDIACDATVLRQSWDLLAHAHYGQADYEFGAFIVREDGRLRLSVWKSGHEHLSAHFEGPVPSNVVAITHTHPNALPRPSDGDIEVARETGLPVYVLTRALITVTEGTGCRVVVNRDWRPVQSGDQVRGGCDTTAAK